ncbi:MAG TPA: hypothetical protein VK668_03685 [Mucilaginibacter sp.]|nr:hypothetical protein [Mucilaginibacter sp.]
MRLFEWRNRDFSRYQEKLPEFVSYLSEVWQSRNKYNEVEEDLTEEERQERNISKQRFFDFTFDGKISARNFVGVVQYDDIRIEVYPKIFHGIKNPDWKQLQFNLLFWLSYCRKIRFPFSLISSAVIDFDNFLEVLIFIFANYTNDVISEQPYQSYQEVTEEVSFLKGRLSFADYIKNNLITGKWQSMYCTHEPFLYDNLFNQIVKYVSKKLLYISSNSLNKQKLNNILFLLDEVSDIQCIANDCNKVKLNPLYCDLDNILSLCRLFLSNATFDTQNESSKNFCFLLPMEYVFEDFSFGFLLENYIHLNIKSQSTDWLATRDSKDVFKIRNDLIINNILIIDTKYKIRSSNNDLKGGVSQSDMYQMISYAIRRKCNKIILLYPYFENANNEDITFTVSIAPNAKPVTINIISINILFEKLKDPVSTIKSEFNKCILLIS